MAAGEEHMQNNIKKTIKGAIFDCDGTLLDSMQMWVRAEAEYLLNIGFVPRPDLVMAVRPLSSLEAADYLKTEYGIPKSIKQINTERNRMLEDYYFNKTMLKDGILSVLESLKTLGVKMCVATATDKYLVEAGLRHCGIIGYFGRILTCSEENTSKTSPDIYIRAAEFLGTDISDTVVFEDALHAIKSAKRAGFPVAAIYDRAEDDHQDEIRRISDYYYTSFESFS
jgi:HAD superfamily hydrolase (TIGR01509 family)